MKERMLLCLKYVGRMSRAKVSGSVITKESPLGVQMIAWSVCGLETIWKSLVRKGAMLEPPRAPSPPMPSIIRPGVCGLQSPRLVISSESLAESH